MVFLSRLRARCPTIIVAVLNLIVPHERRTMCVQSGVECAMDASTVDRRDPSAWVNLAESRRRTAARARRKAGDFRQERRENPGERREFPRMRSDCQDSRDRCPRVGIHRGVAGAAAPTRSSRPVLASWRPSGAGDWLTHPLASTRILDPRRVGPTRRRAGTMRSLRALSRVAWPRALSQDETTPGGQRAGHGTGPSLGGVTRMPVTSSPESIARGTSPSRLARSATLGQPRGSSSTCR